MLTFNKLSNLYIDSFKGLSRPVWILAIAMFINRSGMMVIPFMSLYLRQELGFTYGQVGNVLAFFGVGAGIGAYLGGILVEKLGSRNVQIGSLVLTAIAFGVLEQMHSYIFVCIMVLITSIISESFRPANMTALTFFSSEKNRTRSISLIRLAVNLGYTIGPAIGGVVTGLWGFNWIFWLDGGASVMAAIYLSQKLPHIIEKHKVKERIKSSYYELLQNKWFLGFIVLNALMMTVFMQLMSSLPLFYREGLKMSEWQIGLVLGSNGLLIGVMEMPIVFVAEQKYKHIKVILMGSFLIGVSYFLLVFNGHILYVIVVMSFLSIGEILQMPFSSGLILKRVKESQISRAMALYSVSFSLAFILAPKLGFYLIRDYGYSVLWYASFGVTLFVMLGYAFLERIFRS